MCLASSNTGQDPHVTGPVTDATSEQTWKRFAAGSVDAAPVINRALASGSVVLPCGSYRISSPVTGLSTDGRVLRGLGPGCVTLKVVFPAGDVIRIVGGASFVTVENLTIEADVARTQGAMIKVASGFHARISDVMITARGSGIPFDGIVVDGANTLGVDDVEIRGATRYGYHLTGHATDISIMRSNVVGSATAIDVDDASGVWLTNMDLIGSSGTGVWIHPTGTGAFVNALYATGVWTDSGAGNGWEFGGSGSISEVHLTGCWAASSGTTNKAIAAARDGILIDGPGVDGLSIENTEVLNNGGFGIDIASGRDVSVLDTNVRMNSMFVAGRYDGIRVGGATTNVRIENNFSGDGGFVQGMLKARNHQRYGVSIAPSSATAIITMIGNQTSGNILSGVAVREGYKLTVDVGNVWR